jgi:hypothetical protein
MRVHTRGVMFFHLYAVLTRHVLLLVCQLVAAGPRHLFCYLNIAVVDAVGAVACERLNEVPHPAVARARKGQQFSA